MTQTVRLECAPPLAEIILDQPRRRNALSLEMWAALPGLVAAANRDDRVKVILLHGGGNGVFAAGADISEFPVIYGTRDAARESGRTIARALDAIEHSARPVIAAIEGACVGGGVSLAAASDLRIAAPTASFGVTPAKLGLIYPPADMLRLVRLVGPGAARRLLFTGQIFSAADALQMRLIDEIVGAQSILRAARALGLEIAAQSPASVQGMKRLLRGLEAGLDPGSPEAEAAFLDGFAHPDFSEGVSAFLAKRKPDWKG